MYQAILAGTKKNWFLILLLIMGTVLMFTHLGARYFWDDEAFNAVLAQNILKHNLPLVWDGRNLIDYPDLNISGQNFIQNREPWLQFYLTAGSFLIFGANNFAGRLPFVLVSLGTIILFYYFSLKYSSDKGIARLATLLLVLSPSFILYSRQCRYYALIIFFTVAMLYTYLNLSLKNKNALVFFTLSASLLFHSNYLVFSAIFSGLLLAFLVWDFNRDRLKALAISLPGIVLLTLPWFLYAKAYTRGGEGIISLPRFHTTLQKTWWCFQEYNFFSWFPFLFVFCLPLILVRRQPGKKEWDRKYLFLITLVIITTLFTTHFSELILIADTHHTINLLPLFCLLIGAIAIKIKRWHQTLFYIMIGLLMFTNLFSLTFCPGMLPPSGTLKPQVRSKIETPLLNYLYEITHHLDDPRWEVSEYLLKNGNHEDYVLVSPFYESVPLIFYTKMRFCGNLVPEIAKTFWDRLPSYIYSSEVIPDWIVLFGSDSQSYIREDIVKSIKKKNIQYQCIPLDVFFRASPRPELPWHNFKDVNNFNAEDRVFILRRIGKI